MAALAIAIVFAVAAVPAVAQNAVPPAARQAATDPAFAARLADQAAAQKASKARRVAPSRRALPQYGNLYDNGPYNGNTDAWEINFGFSTSDSFTGGGPVTGLHFVYWDASPSDLLTTVDISIGATSFGGTPQTLTGVTNTFLGMNLFGYFLYQADYSFSGIGPGSYVTLSNACTTSGCSVSNPIYWDENSGVGCTSQGCPSTAYENNLGSIPSESFSLDGGGGPQCIYDQPPHFKIIHDFTDQEAGPSSGVTVDRAGSLYGSAGGGDYGQGLIYKLVQNAGGWVLNRLYSFTGGSSGELPDGVIIGPYGGLYGGAYGGIQGCGSDGSYYCGLAYNLRPRPNACRTPPCSWTETTLYEFSGNSDAWDAGVSTFDQAGNLYGIGNGGAYGQGAVYQLTPSHGGWTEKILYSFTGGSDGKYPASLLMGKDGNLYGTTYQGGDPKCGFPNYSCGTVFRLAPSGGGWTENVIHTFAGGGQGGDGFGPWALVQDSSGNLYGLTTHWVCPPGLDCAYFGIVFELSPSYGKWQFTVLYDTARGETCSDTFHDLAIDSAGNLYVTGGIYEPSCGPGSWGYVLELPDGPLGVGFPVDIFADLTVDASGNVYGTTSGCGEYDKGTVWKLSP
jgi:uncharacterized repeat protein (TIGR03803 family)